MAKMGKVSMHARLRFVAGWQGTMLSCKPVDVKSARTVGAKGRVFPEALTQSALAGGGGPFFAGKMHGTVIYSILRPQTVCGSFWCYNFAARIVTNKMWNLGAV